jgi:hypothetical protein
MHIFNHFLIRLMLPNCSSPILSNFKPCFNATAVQRLIDSGAIPIGKTVMDEFGMGSFTLNRKGAPSNHVTLFCYVPIHHILKVNSARIPAIRPKLPVAAAAAALPLSLIRLFALLLAATQVAVFGFQPLIAKLLDSSPVMEASVATVS